MSEPAYRTPSPDRGHEAIRKPLADAIDDLAMNYELVDFLFVLIDEATQQIATLTARVTALEPATPEV